MTDPSGRLYALLPAIYRVRDTEHGLPLRALLAVMEREFDAMEMDIDTLADDAFIETCADWVVPYIGDLLGVRGVAGSAGTPGVTPRAYVANTIAYRRRKGTAAVLEQLARDVTGWPARAVEYFQRLATTQHVNHVRPASPAAVEVRRANPLELLRSAFDVATYSAEVRRIAPARGRYNVPNVGLHLWRLAAYAVPEAAPCPVPEGGWTIHPFGLDAPLFNPPSTEESITHLATERDVPGRLRRRPLYDEVEALRAAAGASAPITWFDAANPVFSIKLDGESIPAEQIRICDLSDWGRPPAVTPAGQPIALAIDPVRGRITLPEPEPGEGPAAPDLRVTAALGFSADIGGGPYDRRESLEASLGGSAVTWQAGVSGDLTDDDAEHNLFRTLGAAVAAWNALGAAEEGKGHVGLITIMDSRIYAESLVAEDAVRIPPRSRLLIASADWPETAAETESPERKPGDWSAAERRACIRGVLEVRGAEEADDAGALVLNGVWVRGRVTVLPGELGRLEIAHCTIHDVAGAPGDPALRASSDDADGRNDALTVVLESSVCGPIELAETVPGLKIANSIIRAASDAAPAVAADGTEAEVTASTVRGTTTVRSLVAGDSIWTGVVTAARRQEGCVRFCWLPTASRTARRYRCQPALALEEAATAAEQRRVLARVRPQFTSTDIGDPAFFQLAARCPAEIRTGASDGSEMGAFSILKQPQREAALRLALDEYLRFGLEAGLFFET